MGPVSVPPEPTSFARKHRTRRFLLLALLPVVVVICALAWTDNRPFVWLTPAQASRAVKPSLLSSLLSKLAVWSPRFRQYYLKGYNIRIDATMLDVTPITANLTGLGMPIATNANGMQVWIIPPTTLSNLLLASYAVPNVDIMSRPRIQTRNGMACDIRYAGPPAYFSGSFYSTQILPSPNNYPFLDLKVIPTRVSEMFKLTFDLQSQPAPFITNSPVFKLGGFRATVSNAWGLVINCGDVHSQRDAGCWILISSTLCDTNGNPLKP